MPSPSSEDHQLIDELNERTGAGLVLEGRALAGALGGALFVRWPDGRRGVVTTFPGTSAEADRLVSVLNQLHDRDLPVPRHDLVADLGRVVVIVQERLAAGPTRPFSAAQVDSIWTVNERFAGAAVGLAEVPDLVDWFTPDDGFADLLPGLDQRTRDVLTQLLTLTTENADVLAGDDVVHVDLNAANVLFDEHDQATGMVDWNLGAYRGNRRVALVHTRFDREWFVRRTDADPDETAAARYLDEVLTDRIDPAELRVWWAFWLLHHLPSALRGGDRSVLDWQLELAESRLA